MLCQNSEARKASLLANLTSLLRNGKHLWVRMTILLITSYHCEVCSDSVDHLTQCELCQTCDCGKFSEGYVGTLNEFKLLHLFCNEWQPLRQLIVILAVLLRI